MDTVTSANTEAQAQIRTRVESWLKAVETNNLKMIMSHYAPDVVAFDAIVQLQFKGAEAYGKHWEDCMQMCNSSMTFQLRELDIAVDGNLAFAHCLLSCGAKDETGEQRVSWMRMTTCYKKTGSAWLIAHEHISAPFDVQTNKALFDMEPDGSIKLMATPRGMNTVTPHLVCAGASNAVEFYKKAFNATEMGRLAGPDGKLMHAAVRIGDSVVMLMDEFPECGAVAPTTLKGTPVSVHLYVDHVDMAIERAVAAGAKVIMPADDMFWGDRYGVLEDPFGHHWSIATHIRDLSHDEIVEASKSAMCGADAQQKT